MTIQIDGSSFLQHLTKFHNITDEEIEEMASRGGGLDAQEALNIFLERDWCRSISFGIVEELQKYVRDMF